MPESYTHVYIATETLMLSGYTVASRPAFMAGANGPDPLYNYRLWQKKPRPNLRVLASMMHHEETGAFLCALLRNASTPVQQSYALGFVSHYITDCTFNPYLSAIAGQANTPEEEGAKNRIAALLDSTVYHMDYKTTHVPPYAGTPVLITNELAEVVTLLQKTVGEVYDKSISLLCMADAYHDNLFVRRRMASAAGRLFLAAIEHSSAEKYGGRPSRRAQSAKRLPRMPQHWKNPYSGEEMNLTLTEVLALAEQTGAVCITAAMRYWLGELEEEKLAAVLGSNDYTTGLPCAPKVDEGSKAVPPQEEMQAEPLPHTEESA